MIKPLYLHKKMKKLPPNQPKLVGAYNYLMALSESFKYVYVDGKKNKTITVPRGFLIDGASIPRTMWRLIGSPFLPMFQKAATVHDYLYTHHKVSRKKADQIFREILKDNTVSKVKAGVMYAAVRTGGYFAYKKGKSK